jgi:peptidoglycan/LPS O-acetylase OafA/YrhL
MNTKERLKNVFPPFFPFIISLLFFLATHYAIFNCLSMIHAISITLNANHADIITIYYDDSRHPVFTEKQSSSKKISFVNQTEQFIFKIHGKTLTGLRIDPGVNTGKIRIYQMEIYQTLKRRKVINANEIYNHFSSRLNHNVSLTLNKDYVEVTVTGEDPFIVATNGLLPISLPLYSYIPILIGTFYLYKKILTIPPKRFFSFFSPCRKLHSSNTSIIEPLDGLRGFATLLVVGEHTLPSFLGAGHSGVLIFFALSGFLLTKPFVNQPQKLCQIKFLVKYGERRLKRILPMYYFYLFMVYGMSLRLYHLTMHAFFLEGRGHLWTMPQEMVFYLLFPVVVMIHHKVFKNNTFAIISFLLLFICVWKYGITIDSFYLFGMADKKLPLLIPIFLFGSCFSYIYFGVMEEYLNNKGPSDKINYFFSSIAIIIISMFLVFSNGNLLGNTIIYSMKYRIWFGLCAGILIFTVCCIRNNALTKVLSSLPLASIGVVSYSLYLIHPLVINLVKPLGYTGVTFFIAVLLISYFFACFTYNFIENHNFRGGG